MDVQQIKTSKTLTLKPNGIFSDVSIPFKYQRRAPLLMLLRPRMILGDDVGLGKTLEICLLASYLKAQKQNTRFLIFTEKTALRQWAAHFDWLCPSISHLIVTADTHVDIPARVKTFRNHGRDVLLSNYNMIYDYWRYMREGMGERWVFVADEPDLFRNTTTKMHEAAFDLVNGPGGAARAYGTTAAIIGNRLDEAFGTLRIIAPGIIPSEKYFFDHFCKMARVKIKSKKGKYSYRKKIIGYKNLGEFRQLIEPAYYGRLQTDPEVEQDLPEPMPRDVEVVLGKEQSWKVVEAMEKLLTMPDGEASQLQLLPSMTFAQLITDDPRTMGYDIVGAKTEATLDLLQHSLREERVVIYSKFRKVIDVFEKDLKAAHIDCVRITGKETWEQKFLSRDRFADDSDPARILLMTKAGQRAIDKLQCAGFIIFADLPWAYDAYRQAIGRLKRTGSTFKKLSIMRMMGVLHPEVAAQTGDDKTIDQHTKTVVLGSKKALWDAITGDAEEVDAQNSDLYDILQQIKASRKP